MNFIDIFKVLGDETRARIVNLLIRKQLCVSEIETILNITQSNASRHLTRLKVFGIIDYEKKAQWTYYYVSKEFVDKNKFLVKFLVENFNEYDKCIDDLKRLERYSNHNCDCKQIMEHKEDVLKIISGVGECTCTKE